MKKHCIRLTEILISVLLALLLVFNVFAASVIIIRYSTSGNQASAAASSAGSSYPGEYTTQYLTPDFIGAHIGDFNKGLFSGSNIVREAYASLSLYIASAFGEQSDCTKTADSDTWSEIRGSDNYIYIRFHTELPLFVVFSHSDDVRYSEKTSAAGDADAYVREMFIILTPSEQEGLYRFSAAVMDNSGNCLLYTPQKSSGYTSASGKTVYFDADAFKNSTDYSEASSFEFYAEIPTLYSSQSKIADTQPVMSDSPDSKRYSKAGNPALLSFASDCGEILSLFDFSADKAGSYTDTDGSVVFIETHGTLRTGSSGFSYSAASDGGIDLYGYVPLTVRYQGTDVFACILAAENITSAVSAADNRLTGGDAELVLSAVTAEDDASVSVSFIYCLDNIEYYSQSARYAVKLTFKGSKLIYADFRSINFENSVTRIKNYSAEWILRVLASSISFVSERTYFGLVYADSDIVPTLDSEWILKK